MRDYGQTAVITTVLPRKFHEHVAYERFTPRRPLALLPLADGRCTLVLDLEPGGGRGGDGLVRRGIPRRSCSARFGLRLGRFLKVGRRARISLVLEPCAAHERGPLHHRRQCRARAASGRRHGLQPGIARRREPRRAHRRAARAISTGCRRRTMSGAPPTGARSSRSPMGWCGSSPIRSGPVQAAAQSRASGIRPAAAREGGAVGALHRRGRAHSQARARRAARTFPTGRRGAAMSRDFDVVVVGAGVIGAAMAALLWRAAAGSRERGCCR